MRPVLRRARYGVALLTVTLLLASASALIITFAQPLTL